MSEKFEWRITEHERQVLQDPANSLPLYGKVFDQESGDEVLYDPSLITADLQNTIISYVSEPPMTPDGYARWLVVLKYRQGGASTAAAMAFYPKAAYNKGWNHITIADNKDRADGLHERIMFTHSEWPEDIRTEQIVTTETRNLTLENYSRMRVLSGHSEAVGIGRSVSSMLASEVAYWANARRQFSLIIPSMQNKRYSMMLTECTPAPLDAPSAEWWRDKCYDASKGGPRARDLYAFFPFWDGKLNRRPWFPDDRMDSEEEDLYEKFGPLGMTMENLAFRRTAMESDPDIRRNHELFGVYFPFDDVSCWIESGNSSIAKHVMAKHASTHRAEKLVPVVLNDGQVVMYEQMEPPQPGSMYVIGADPAGYGGRDHAAFQVLELWAGEWRQVASFGAVIDPSHFEMLLFKVGILYNEAMIAVERNGVGVATIELLKRDGYPHIYVDMKFKKGIHKGSHDEFMSILVDKLLDVLVILGTDTYTQLTRYKSDKAIQKTVEAEIRNPNMPPGTRRPRHHWDKVSALMVACCAGERMGRRFRPKVDVFDNVVPFRELSWNQLQDYAKRVEKANKKPQLVRRSRYTRRRR